MIFLSFGPVNLEDSFWEPASLQHGEFFILRKHRGQGVGQIAAEQLFSSQPGSWEVAVARKNVPALEFWRKTIQTAGKASNVRELDLRCAEWNGPVFQFDWT